jgi:hypothetical protein
MVGNADGAPTKQARELFAVLDGQVTEQLDKLKGVLELDLAAFNRAVAESGTAAITLDRGA